MTTIVIRKIYFYGRQHIRICICIHQMAPDELRAYRWLHDAQLFQFVTLRDSFT